MASCTIKSLCRFPQRFRKAMTTDNGKEFAHFRVIEEALGASIFFARPYASWERGTCENTNGLLREFLPKGSDPNAVTTKQLSHAVGKPK